MFIDTLYIRVYMYSSSESLNISCMYVAVKYIRMYNEEMYILYKIFIIQSDLPHKQY